MFSLFCCNWTQLSRKKSQQKNMWRCKTRTISESILNFSKIDNTKWHQEKNNGLTLASHKLGLSSRYYVSVIKACSWLEIGVSLWKLLQMIFYNIVFQRKLILKHQNFNFISGNFRSLCASYAILVLDLPNEEHLKIE